MSHKDKICLKVQAANRFKKITHLGQSKHNDKKAAGLEYDQLCKDGQKPDMSKQEYINNAIRDKIYSINTYKTYAKHNNYFLKFCEDKGCKTLEQCREHVPEWLNSRIEGGLSAYTIQMEAAALGKLYQCSVHEFGVNLPERNRNDITRSRGVAERDRGFSLEKNSEIIDFCRGTGLRRSELKALTKDQLIKHENGDYALKIKGKGGRERVAPIIGPHKAEIVERIEHSSGTVWEKIPSHMDVHAYRSDYATAIYKAYERPLEELKDVKFKDPRTGKETGALYHCRGDRKGEAMDKEAMLKASEALGHSRIDVVAGHYIR